MSTSATETSIAAHLGAMSTTDIEAIASHVAEELETLERVRLAVRCAENGPTQVAGAISHDVENSIFDVIFNRFDEGGDRKEYAAAVLRWQPTEGKSAKQSGTMRETVQRVATMLREQLGVDERTK